MSIAITNAGDSPPGKVRGPQIRGRLREQVISLAVAAARKGAVEGLSMRDLSRRLGVSPAAIYRHFEHRDAVLKAVTEAGFAEFEGLLQNVMPFTSAPIDASDAVRRFEGLVVAYVRFARTHYGLWRLMFGPTGCESRFRDPSGAPTYMWLGKSLAELEAFGRISTATAADQYFAWTAVHGFADLHSGPGGETPLLDDLSRQQARRILRALGADADALAP